jgi:hypothetical protein
MEEHIDNNAVLFQEHYAAAQSLRSVWTRLASTYGCIMIVLSRETLTIKPHWFARWLITLLRLDLFHNIPITNIVDVRGIGEWSSYGKVELHFHTMEGEDKRVLSST